VSLTAREEWKKYWTLPASASIGNTASILHIYSLGAFMIPLNEAFGWSRAQVSSGITVSNSLTGLLGILIGVLIDRWGPRRVGLIGICIMGAAFSMLSTATGSYMNWLFLWGFIALGATWTQTTIWTGAVSTRFDKSRGLAIAMTISGSGMAATLLPILATEAIEGLGWRYAFLALGLGWWLIAMPLNVLFFRGSADAARTRENHPPPENPQKLSGVSAKECFTSFTFYRLAIAGGLFSFCAMGLIVHFVPVLIDRGLGTMQAAGIAGLVGIASIAGRFGTGLLLDRFRPERVALFAFALPTITALCLLYGQSPLAYSVAAIVMGFSLGAELDVIIYLSTRHFGLRRFGIIFATTLLFLTTGTALGPVSAGAIFDNYGSYSVFLMMIIPMVLTGALLVGTMRRAPDLSAFKSTAP